MIIRSKRIPISESFVTCPKFARFASEMDGSTVVDLSVLKTLPLTIQSSNHNERKQLFEELDNVLIYSKLLNETNEGMWMFD